MFLNIRLFIKTSIFVFAMMLAVGGALADRLDGDFDSDGRADAADAAILFRNVLNISADLEKEESDVTRNGAVTRADVKLVLLAASGKVDDIVDAVPFLSNQLIGEEDMERFCYKGTVNNERMYRSANVSVEISEFEFQNSICHLLDVVVRDAKSLRSAFSSGEYKGKRQYPGKIARECNAIFAVTGDMYLKNAKGAFVRNGVWYDKSKDVSDRKDICVMYEDGSIEIFPKGTASISSIEKGIDVWQLWSFGPMLLDEEGEPMSRFHCSPSIEGNNPRSALGYYSPGHYCLVVVDGRQKPYSSGLCLEDLSDLMYQLGCSSAYNLDGGQSAAMVAGNGKTISSPSSGGRTISDIVIVAEPPVL